MLKKSIWLSMSFVIVVAMVLASCKAAPTTQGQGTQITGTVTGQPTTPSQPTTPVTTTGVTPQKEMIKDALGRTVEKPQYGGILTSMVTVNVQSFDPLNVDQAACWTMHYTNDKLSVGDWNSGPAGTGADSWQLPGIWDIKHEVGELATSWEIQGNDTIIFHIRQGVHFQDKPPVNGREMTADDVAYSITRVMVAKTFLGNSYGVGTTTDNGPTSVQAIDKWTVVAKCPPSSLGSLLQNFNVGIRIVPKEMVTQWGDLTNWRSACGTGPYLLTDYVPDSSVTFARNPNYWRDHPMYPGMKMPFTDGVKVLIIPDTSTQVAAIITGKVDSNMGVTPTDAASIAKSRPDVQESKILAFSGPTINFRLDKNLPETNLKVRRALSMAIDRDAIIQGYYQGQAEKFCHPILPVPELSDIFVPLNQMPQTVQENYSFNPDMAKKLLTDAGYPNGFPAKIVCYQPQVDVLSIVRDYWSKIGVTLTLDVRDSTVWQTINRTSTQDDMLMTSITNIYYTAPLEYLSSQIPTYDRSHGVDPYVDQYYQDNMLPYQSLKDDVLRANLKKLVPYLLDLVWVVELPSPYNYTVWQPWVKDYHAEYSVGRGNHGDWPMYVWMDTGMKAKVTGQK